MSEWGENLEPQRMASLGQGYTDDHQLCSTPVSNIGAGRTCAVTIKNTGLCLCQSGL